MAEANRSGHGYVVSDEKRAEIREMIRRAMRESDERRARGPQPMSDRLKAWIAAQPKITEEQRRAAIEQAAATPWTDEELAESEVAWEEFQKLEKERIERERGVSGHPRPDRLVGS